MLLPIRFVLIVAAKKQIHHDQFNLKSQQEVHRDCSRSLAGDASATPQCFSLSTQSMFYDSLAPLVSEKEMKNEKAWILHHEKFLSICS